MRKLLVALIATASASSFAASGVGASNPNSATNEKVVAIAETGVSASWTSKAFENKASAHQIAELNDQFEFLNKSMVESLNYNIERKVKIQTQKLFIN